MLLVLVPRHPERGAQVAAVASSSSGTEANGSSATAAVARRSVGEAVLPETSVYVCDTLGELPVLYGLTGIAFVGGSLVPLGGHSLLEAAQATDGCAAVISAPCNGPPAVCFCLIQCTDDDDDNQFLTHTRPGEPVDSW